MATTSNAAMLVSPFASGTINWRCLSSAMQTPYETNFPNYYYGNVVCEGGNFAVGAAMAAVLIIVHVAFLLSPIAVGYFIFKSEDRLKPHVRSFPTLIMAMSLFVLASAGEIGQHCFDNWLYLNSRVSAFNFAFYFLTLLSNGVLAAGLGYNTFQLALTGALGLTVPASFLYVALFDTSFSMSTAAQIPIWIGMFITVLMFIVRAWIHLDGSRKKKIMFTTVDLVLNGVGVVFANNIITTGHQYWHLVTAGSFCAGFLLQAAWLCTSYPEPPTKASSRKEE